MKKIFTFFRKNAPIIRLGNTHGRGNACQERNFPVLLPVLTKYTFLKKFGKTNQSIKMLCKRIMHNPLQIHRGSPLWKNLWRLWKSLSFPQAFVKKRRIPQQEMAYKKLYILVRGSFVTVLRCLVKKVTKGGFFDEKVGKTVHCFCIGQMQTKKDA